MEIPRGMPFAYSNIEVPFLLRNDPLICARKAVLLSLELNI